MIIPKITINGMILTDQQVLPILYALDRYDDYLADNGLGEDKLALSITENYRQSISEIKQTIDNEILDFDTR